MAKYQQKTVTVDTYQEIASIRVNVDPRKPIPDFIFVLLRTTVIDGQQVQTMSELVVDDLAKDTEFPILGLNDGLPTGKTATAKEIWKLLASLAAARLP